MKNKKLLITTLVIVGYIFTLTISIWKLESFSPISFVDDIMKSDLETRRKHSIPLHSALSMNNTAMVHSSSNETSTHRANVFTNPTDVRKNSMRPIVQEAPVVTRDIVYGAPLPSGNRTPLVMIRSNLDKEMHKQMLEVPMFSCPEENLDSMGLDKRVKVPIYIYEGYFHSLSTPQRYFSKNPNPLIGKDFLKPAATPILRAFYEAFRQINHDIFDKLKNELMQDAVKRSPRNPERDVCYGLGRWIEQGRLFGDLSIQIHYGKGNLATFGRAWHVDAENSLLHLAVTLRGERVLHSRRRGSPQGPVDEVLEEQRAGDVYLSSSALMMHAPLFSDTSYDTRVIAIHSRILYTSAEINEFRAGRSERGWERMTSILADNLASAAIKIPTVEQVEDVRKTFTDPG